MTLLLKMDIHIVAALEPGKVSQLHCGKEVVEWITNVLHVPNLTEGMLWM